MSYFKLTSLRHVGYFRSNYILLKHRQPIHGVNACAGVTAKLDYLKDLNADAILLSSIYEAENGSNPDFGYEVTNHTAIDSEYGTIDDLQNLIAEARKRGLLLIIYSFVVGGLVQWKTSCLSNSKRRLWLSREGQTSY